MAIVDWFVRLDSNTAQNTNVNVSPDPAFSVQFATDGNSDQLPDNLPGGDLKIEQPSSDPNNLQPDPDTIISLDGGVTWQTFTYIISGTVPQNKNPAGEELTLIVTEDGTRLVFRSDDPSEAGANAISNGAIAIQNTNTDPNPVCFTRGAMILTPGGERPVETLRAGDLVVTRSGAARPIRWIGSRRVAAEGRFAPVRIRAGALGDHRETLVSQQHRMLLTGWRAELMFGAPEVLAKAMHIAGAGAAAVAPGGEVEYFHILFDRHEIVRADGAWSESFHPGAQALRALDGEARAEVLALFPELAADPAGGYGPAAAMSLRAHETRALVAG